MAQVTKVQGKLKEMIDSNIEYILEGLGYTDKKVKQKITQQVKNRITDSLGIDEVYFYTEDNETLSLTDLVLKETKEHSNKNKVEEILKAFGIDYETRILSGDYQVEFKLADHEVVINEGEDKDKEFAIFFGDLSVQLNEEELVDFIKDNIHLTLDLSSIKKEIDDFENFINSTIGGNKELMDELESRIDDTGYYGSRESDTELTIRFGVGDVVFKVINGSLHVYVGGGYHPLSDKELMDINDTIQHYHNLISKN